MITDFITILLSIFLIIRGAMRGFLNSLLGPFSIIATTILSAAYYQATQNFLISLLIGLIGPILLHLLLRFFLNQFLTVKNPNFTSRVAGSALTLLWGWVFIIFTLVLLAVLPPWGENLTALRNDVLHSNSYSVAKPLVNKIFAVPPEKQKANPTDAASDTQSLAQDPRFQAILQDPEIQNEINTHDFAKLMRNPKILDLTRQLMSDPAAMKKLMSVYNSSLGK